MGDTMKVTNNTEQPRYANVGGVAYEILPGKSVNVDARTAMILGEYDGLTINRDAVETQLAKDAAASRQAATGEPRIEPVVSPSSEHGPDAEPTPSETLPAVATGPAAATVDPRTVDASEAKGAELDAALEAADLAKSGSADEKRARLAAWQEEQG